MKCALCNQPLRTTWSLAEITGGRPLVAAQLCGQCAAQFERIDWRAVCPDCGRVGTKMRCADCERWHQMGVPSLHHRGLFTYNEAMKAYVERYKGIGDYNLRRCFAKEIGTLRMKRVAFVPLTTEPQHYAVRGFDPVVGLFEQLPLQFWLRKDNTRTPQAKKNRQARMTTPQSFKCLCASVNMNLFQKVCLLDDLYTTGRTFHHAAAALRDAGFEGSVISRSLIR